MNPPERLEHMLGRTLTADQADLFWHFTRRLAKLGADRERKPPGVGVHAAAST